MLTQQTVPLPQRSPDGLVECVRQPRSFARYFFWLFLLPGICYFATIPLVRLPSYERWGPSHWGPQLDFPYQAEGVDADVVIFGDSSAFLGVDPLLLKRQLGLKAVVLPNTVGSLPVMADKALTFYLSRNTRPRLIVLYFSSWNLDFDHFTENRMFEGEEMMLRHDRPREIFKFVLAHPMELTAYPLRNYSSIGGHYLHTLLHRTDRVKEAALALGHAADTEDYPRLDTNCSFPVKLTKPQGFDSVARLAQKYRAQGYRVAVYLAPLPACSNAAVLVSRDYSSLAIAPPGQLPPSSFLADGRFAHVGPESVPAATYLFGEAMRHSLER